MSPRSVRVVVTTVAAFATLAYPFVIYMTLGRVEPRWMALLLVGLALLRAWATRDPFWLAAAAGAATLGLASMVANDAVPLKLYPALINAVLLLAFGASLVRPPTAIERLARLQEPQLAPAAVAYTRRVTQVWCGFFLVNGTVALVTATHCSHETWVLYNGFVAYALMGILFGGEWLMRQRVKARITAKGTP